MKADTLTSDDFKQCADFHGHVCPGLAIGYQAAKAGIAWLEEHRAMDEEVVAIVETNACGVDAVQVLTGCTFGKGNFIHKDHGKQVFTFMSRESGKGTPQKWNGKNSGPFTGRRAKRFWKNRQRRFSRLKPWTWHCLPRQQ
jgi:formylmethanofuran dehydrogenase subunit E